MPRIGRLPLSVPQGVSLAVKDRLVVVSGPKGRLELPLPQDLILDITGKTVRVKLSQKRRQARMDQGTLRSLLAGALQGVSQGHTRTLELRGVGYRAWMQEEGERKKLILRVGASHDIELAIPEGIDLAIEKNTIILSGIEKALVGRVAAEIRALRPPEPYKGKGIRYLGEVVRRKVGKAAKVVGVRQ